MDSVYVSDSVTLVLSGIVILCTGHWSSKVSGTITCEEYLFRCIVILILFLEVELSILKEWVGGNGKIYWSVQGAIFLCVLNLATRLYCLKLRPSSAFPLSALIPGFLYRGGDGGGEGGREQDGDTTLSSDGLSVQDVSAAAVGAPSSFLSSSFSSSSFGRLGVGVPAGGGGVGCGGSLAELRQNLAAATNLEAILRPVGGGVAVGCQQQHLFRSAAAASDIALQGLAEPDAFPSNRVLGAVAAATEGSGGPGRRLAAPLSLKTASALPCGVWVTDEGKDWRVVERRRLPAEAADDGGGVNVRAEHRNIISVEVRPRKEEEDDDDEEEGDRDVKRASVRGDVGKLDYQKKVERQEKGALASSSRKASVTPSPREERLSGASLCVRTHTREMLVRSARPRSHPTLSADVQHLQQEFKEREKRRGGAPLEKGDQQHSFISSARRDATDVVEHEVIKVERKEHQAEESDKRSERSERRHLKEPRRAGPSGSPHYQSAGEGSVKTEEDGGKVQLPPVGPAEDDIIAGPQSSDAVTCIGPPGACVISLSRGLTVCVGLALMSVGGLIHYLITLVDWKRIWSDIYFAARRTWRRLSSTASVSIRVPTCGMERGGLLVVLLIGALFLYLLYRLLLHFGFTRLGSGKTLMPGQKSKEHYRLTYVVDLSEKEFEKLIKVK